MESIEIPPEQFLEQTSTNGSPDRAKTQRWITDHFIVFLIPYVSSPILHEKVQAFSDRWENTLNWLGVDAMNEILREAEKTLNIDLSNWSGYL